MGPTNSSSRKKSKSNEKNDKKENNFTLLTLLYCIKILVGNFIDSFSLFLSIFSVDIYVKYGFINIVGNSLFFASHGVSIFLYFYFYKAFRKQCFDLFRCRR